MRGVFESNTPGTLADLADRPRTPRNEPSEVTTRKLELEKRRLAKLEEDCRRAKQEYEDKAPAGGREQSNAPELRRPSDRNIQVASLPFSFV